MTWEELGSVRVDDASTSKTTDVVTLPDDSYMPYFSFDSHENPIIAFDGMGARLKFNEGKVVLFESSVAADHILQRDIYIAKDPELEQRIDTIQMYNNAFDGYMQDIDMMSLIRILDEKYPTRLESEDDHWSFQGRPWRTLTAGEKRSVVKSWLREFIEYYTQSGNYLKFEFQDRICVVLIMSEQFIDFDPWPREFLGCLRECTSGRPFLAQSTADGGKPLWAYFPPQSTIFMTGKSSYGVPEIVTLELWKDYVILVVWDYLYIFPHDLKWCRRTQLPVGGVFSHAAVGAAVHNNEMYIFGPLKSNPQTLSALRQNLDQIFVSANRIYPGTTSGDVIP